MITRTPETPDAKLGDLVAVLTEGKAGGDSGLVKPTRCRAVAWARVSTDMQEQRGLSLPEQLAEIREYADERGIEIVAEFHETASAYRRYEKRAEFHRMLQYTKDEDGVSAVLVHDLSRFSRDSVGAQQLVKELLSRGIDVISLNDPHIDPDTVAGVYMSALTFAKNEAFSVEVAMHTRKGCRANAQARDTETGWCYKNGGQPLWGYRARRLNRGTDKKGRPIFKTIWELDDTEVAGKPMHEWVRHMLTELAAKGASLDQLKNACNEAGIPARRSDYWATSTWNSLLTPHALLKYSGYGVWNVHRKNGSVRPPSEWVVVPQAHPAIISEEVAVAISEARRKNSKKCFGAGRGRTATSPYLLSGGLFKCERCGANMVGHKTSHGTYYVCGSQPYRSGMGCGRGVYVRKDEIESEVIAGMTELVEACADPEGFARTVNEKLRQVWESMTGHDPHAHKKIESLDRKIANVRKSIENGLDDTDWANERIAEFKAESEQLKVASEISGEPPQIDVEAAMEYRRSLPKLLERASDAEKKQIVGTWVEDIRLAPEDLEVMITYQIPEPVVNKLVAGARFAPATSRSEE